MVYASAYTYRATVWFDFVVPGPEERAWLRDKYPASWHGSIRSGSASPSAGATADAGIDFAVHGDRDRDVLRSVPARAVRRHAARTTPRRWSSTAGQRYIFCSEPCRWIFEQEPERYAAHKDVVKRVLAGEAPANLLELVQRYFGLTDETWGKDVLRGRLSLAGGGVSVVIPLYGFLRGRHASGSDRAGATTTRRSRRARDQAARGGVRARGAIDGSA